MVTEKAFWLLVLAVALFPACTILGAQDDNVAQLAKEVGGKGWIVYASRGENGTWDLFLMRPDGSRRQNITNTPDYEEGGPRFSPDSRKLLYRRFAKGTVIHHDLWGFQGCLMIAEPDGAKPVQIGGEREFPWAPGRPTASRSPVWPRRRGFR